MPSVFRRFLMSAGLVAALGAGLEAQSAPVTPAPTPPPRSFHVTKVGHGRPMILIPGLLSSGEVWQATAERFRTRYECHVLTLAGFAGQPPAALAGRPFLETVGRDLARYIEAERLESADPGGPQPGRLRRVRGRPPPTRTRSAQSSPSTACPFCRR